jgi:uncharacterized protein
MKRSALALVICLVFACASYAQQDPQDQPASKEDIQRYIEVMNLRQMMKDMMVAMTKNLHQVTHEMLKNQPNLPPDAEQQIDKMSDEMLGNFPVDDMINAMIPVYQRHLTKGEVDALVAFYSAPTGQKILKEMPAMTAEAMQASSGVMQKMMAKATQQVQGQIAEMQKQSGNTKDQN